MSIIVICPSRGRPHKAEEGYQAFLATRTREDSKMVFVVDADDATFNDYVKAKVPVVTYGHEGGGMGPPLNAAAADLALHYSILGFIGDDHRFRTRAWDQDIEDVLKKPGMAFGNDLARNDIPTQVFMSSVIVQALGWMSLPGAKHLYLDNTWRALGDLTGCLAYLPDVVIEHVHPFYGKGEMDEGYARVNQHSMYEHDSLVFQQWVESGRMAEDAEKVKAVL